MDVIDTVCGCLIASTMSCFFLSLLGDLFVELYDIFVSLICYLSILQDLLFLLLLMFLMNFLQTSLVFLCKFYLFLHYIAAISSTFVQGFLHLFLVLFSLKQILSFLLPEELLLIRGFTDSEIYLIG